MTIVFIFFVFFIIIPRPPSSTRIYPLFPYTTRFRSRRPLSRGAGRGRRPRVQRDRRRRCPDRGRPDQCPARPREHPYLRRQPPHRRRRSEEHTSELQSLMRISYAVFCLKTKKKTKTASNHKSEV